MEGGDLDTWMAGIDWVDKACVGLVLSGYWVGVSTYGRILKYRPRFGVDFFDSWQILDFLLILVGGGGFFCLFEEV